MDQTQYAARVASEQQSYAEVTNVHDLPEIFGYWSNKHLLPMIAQFGYSSPNDLFARTLAKAARRCEASPATFLSIGAGNCEVEIAVVALMRDAGLENFSIECLEFNSNMLERGAAAAAAAGVTGYLRFTQADFNAWTPDHVYHGVMANHSLHHVLNLEGLFDAVARSLDVRGYFVVADMIGRNGHQRWPESLELIHRFWAELPPRYRYNKLLQRHEELYENWDCSAEGFEGIRAQDIMPQLLERFDFELFVAFASIILPFIDRAFGHHFHSDGEWDRMFIDRVHAADEAGFADGTLTPCQMYAVMTTGIAERREYSRGISPRQAIRTP